MSQATSVKEVLTAVEWMLENIGWCQGAMFRGEQGEQLSVYGILNGRAIPASMCLTGAFNLVEAEYCLKDKATDLIRETTPDYCYMVEFNDSHTKEQVLAAVKKAKERAT